MASIRKRAGKWDVRWRDPDGSQRTRSCPTATAARALKREIEECVAQGRRWEPRDARPRARIRDIAEEFLIAQARRLRPASIIQYGRQLEAFCRWAEADTSLGDAYADTYFTQPAIERFYDALTTQPSRHGRPRSLRSARAHVEIVQRCWGWAEQRDRWQDQVPRPRRMELPTIAARRPPVAPTWAEMDQAISAARNWHRALLVVMRCTGLRVGQAMRLRRADVDVDAGTLTIRGELGKTRQESRGRRIPLAPPLRDELRNPQITTWGTDWLIPSPSALRRVPPLMVSRIWRRTSAREAAWRGSPDHCFRRGFISGLRQLGAAGDDVEYLVGHMLPGMLAPYVDVDIGLSLREAVGRMPPMVIVDIPLPKRTPAVLAEEARACRRCGDGYRSYTTGGASLFCVPCRRLIRIERSAAKRRKRRDGGGDGQTTS